MTNITFIMPLHEADSNIQEYVKRALTSISNINQPEKPKLLFGTTEENAKIIQDSIIDKGDFNIDYNFVFVSDTDFCSIVNKCVPQCDTKYFSIIELDDEYTAEWVNNFNKYSNEYEASVYLPITAIKDAKNEDRFSGFANEIAWAPSFAEVYGYVDIECLKAYIDFNLTGSIIECETFLSVGGLNKEYEIVAPYEFLTRVCLNEHKVFVIPKVGYLHTIGREGSITEMSSKNPEIANKTMNLLEKVRQQFIQEEKDE